VDIAVGGIERQLVDKVVRYRNLGEEIVGIFASVLTRKVK
jgi:hypothetical protein